LVSRCCLGNDQGQRGQVDVVRQGQQDEAHRAGKHRQDQQFALLQAIDDVAAIQPEQGGDEHRDTQQQPDILLIQPQPFAQKQRQQRTGDCPTDDDGQ
jgi:hypothetical protein